MSRQSNQDFNAMADKNDGGDKTEKPTAKKLRDARKKGDVPKSKDLTSAAGLIVWLGLAAGGSGYAATRIAGLFESLFTTLGKGWEVSGYAGAVRALGWQSVELGAMLVAMLALPAAAIGLLVEFLQAGPVLTFEKLKPQLDKMNPVEGVKRMFSMDNLIELVKATLKTALLFLIGWMVIKAALPDMVALARSATRPAGAVSGLIWHLTVQILAVTLAIFAFVALLDVVYQRYSFTKKMRMSIRDIKQEMKDSEGDPYIKMQRRRTQREMAQQSATQATRTANVLVVNPTHVAIAIDYDRETTPVPTVIAKGEDELALAMREAAAEAGVPVVRNIPLARDLLARAEEGDLVPSDLFEVIAEVILWAREVREVLDAQRRGEASAGAPAKSRIAAPGEDLTQYE
ncbi:MAG TPA: type III secretion system export apparatus subunit SctU [Burkholderiaceae bacterium]|nr:type III secretion system export apparatus subunit SctU [Burkholderiaceae bacterium]